MEEFNSLVQAICAEPGAPSNFASLPRSVSACASYATSNPSLAKDIFDNVKQRLSNSPIHTRLLLLYLLDDICQQQASGSDRTYIKLVGSDLFVLGCGAFYRVGVVVEAPFGGGGC